MQASTLIENVSSDSIAEENAFLPKASPRRILVYVESDEDIAFWRHILHAYESSEMEFDIQTPTKKGKQKAIKKRREAIHLNVGPFLIVCVDSDYDYLLPEHTPDSKLVNSDPYIFQTYSYAMENLQCYGESLHAVCVQATKHDKRVIDLKEFIRTFSKIIYPLFLWNLHFRKNNDQTFTISNFCEIIKLNDKIDLANQCAIAIEGLKSRVDTKIASLEKTHPLAQDEINNIAVALDKMGVNEDSAYLFIQGHTLKDNVVLMVLNPVCQILIADKFEQIKNNSQHKTQEENDRNYYKSQKQDISIVLSSNTEYKNCFLYKKIKADLDNYVGKFNKPE